MKTVLLALAGVLMISASVQAQPVCRTITVPDQGTGLGSGQTLPIAITIPGAANGVAGSRSVGYAFPVGAARVGLMTWNHRIQQSPIVPAGFVILWGVTSNGQRAMVTNPHQNEGYPQDGRWHSFNLSVVLNPGERYDVLMVNYTPDPVTVEFILVLQECR